MISELNRREFLASMVAVLIAPGPPLPPLSWTCPMHAEVVDSEKGTCPICKMELVPVRLALVWSCQLHLDVTRDAPGRCRICGRDLVRIVKALSFMCPAHPKVNEVNPGRCPIDKRTLVATHSLRPHGDHNPKHGGQFFMAPNNWHVEVTHPTPSLFRLYVYDDYGRPFIPRGFTSRIIAMPDAGGRPTDVSIPFTPARASLEARVPKLGLPAAIAVKVRFQDADREYRFDFPFYEYSKEPAARPAAR